MDLLTAHDKEVQRLGSQLTAQSATGHPPALAKNTSNLFRHRERQRSPKLDVHSFCHVLAIDPQRMIADVEGMTTYEALVDETLKHGLLPAVVPQLKTISVGGAVSGLGIESSSFRFGLVHETVQEMEVLLGDGRILLCSPAQNADLFYGFPNSYGTLGYALRLKMRLVPAKRFVHLTHARFSHPAGYFDYLATQCGRPLHHSADFLDGTVFNRSEMYVTAAEFIDAAPHTSDYTWMRMYYSSIRRKPEDWLTTLAYIWRWDTDWFWCSKHFGLRNPLIRFLATPWALNSRTYQRLMRLSHLILPASHQTESVIQDVDIPVENAVEFLHFLLTEIGITPVWVCPFQSNNPSLTYDLCALDPGKLYINFGFWDTIPASQKQGYYNRLVERKAQELGGRKALYSTVCYDEETFWQIYNQDRYFQLKQKYDPGGVFLDLYTKCVGRR